MSGQARHSGLRVLTDRVPVRIGLETAVEVIDDGTLVLSVEGEIDLSTSTRLETELRAALRSRAPAVILDLTGCRFLDCSALRGFVRADDTRDGAGPRFSLVVPDRHVRAIFELTGLDSRFELNQTRVEAIAARANAASASAARPPLPASDTRELVELGL